MSSERKAGMKEPALSDKTIADYLISHPDFFDNHSELLPKLRIPHPSGSAISLIERQVDVLRQQNRTLERKLVDLVEVARSNDSVLERIHRLALTLMECDELSERLAALQDSLRTNFGADEVALLLFRGAPEQFGTGPARRIERDDSELEQFSNFLSAGKPQCGRLRPSQLTFLFGARGEDVGSAALVPVGERASVGILAIGSHKPEHFSPTLGTAFLSRIGELVDRALRTGLSG